MVYRASIYFILFQSLIIGDNPYLKFREFMNSSNGRVLDISFAQNQINNIEKKNGLFYYFGELNYTYDDDVQRIIYNQESITTINKLSKQIIYDENIKNNLNILDILGGKANGIIIEEVLLDENGTRIPFKLNEWKIAGNL